MDINLHMNNGRYFSLMDLGRLDLMLRSLPPWDLISRRLRPIVIDETIRFRKSIYLFQKFEIVSQVVAWTEHDLYIEQKFIAKNQVCARAFVRGRVFNSKGSAIPAKELLSMMGYNGPQKELTGAVKAWAQLPRGG
jgi:acyl-CoA thioesterase FadM